MTDPSSPHSPDRSSGFTSVPVLNINDESLLRFEGNEPSCSFTNGPPQSPVGTFGSEKTVIDFCSAEDVTIGSTQIQQAAGKRRSKAANFKCPYFNTPGIMCKATFTARHNLRYHKYSHQGKRPYPCSKCSYKAGSPATLKRHIGTCKGPAPLVKINAVDIPFL